MSQDAEIRQIAALTHGRYLVDRGDGDEPRGLLLGFHGYGENAGRNLEELRRIPGSERWLRCAVEALHPFYNTKTGEVVACWMTKQGREQAIVDNIRYVAGVIADLRRECPSARRLVMAGFSQGVAMTYRAAARCGHPCDGLIILAGDVPPELAVEPVAPLPHVLLGRGRRDAWYDEAKMSQDLETLERLGATVETCVFDGGHEWGDAFLHAASAFLDERNR